MHDAQSSKVPSSEASRNADSPPNARDKVYHSFLMKTGTPKKNVNSRRSKKRSTTRRAVTITSLMFSCIVLPIGIFIGNAMLCVRPNNATIATGGALKSTTLVTPPSNVSTASTICLTSDCVHIASNILQNMDTSVQPCDDFYKFACGGFLKNPIPDDKSKIDFRSIMGDKIKEQLRISLDEPILESEPKAIKFAKRLYKSCMNLSKLEAQGLRSLLEILDKIGGWPVLEGKLWKEEKFDWFKSIPKLKNLGIQNYFLGFIIEPDFKDRTKRVIHLRGAYLALSQQYLFGGVEDRVVKAYHRFMVDLAVMLGANRKYAEKELLQSLQFEIDLARISSPWRYSHTTIAELSSQFPSIPWEKFINDMLPPSVRVDSSEIMCVDTAFISRLLRLMKITPKQTQANYAMWRIVKRSAIYVTEEMRERDRQYMMILNGKTRRESRWKECIDISTHRAIGLGALYIRGYFDDRTKITVMEMVNNIKKQVHQSLEKIKWLNAETKKISIDKLTSMTSHIAYAAEYLDDRKLEEFFEGLELNQGSYLQQILKLESFWIDYHFKTLTKPVNKTDWITHGHPTRVDARYVPDDNTFIVPAGIMHGAFFNNDRPMYMNYGAMGFAIGHEITHGFDSHGRYRDKNGSPIPIYETAIDPVFLGTVECILNQYEGYMMKDRGIKSDAIRTLAENIADNGGFKVSYLAYKDWAAQNDEEKMLPGLSYSPQQMFWISGANAFCSLFRPEELQSYIYTNKHSQPRFRIIGPFSNIAEFSEDFKCPVDSKMNPAKKCSVW